VETSIFDFQFYTIFHWRVFTNFAILFLARKLVKKVLHFSPSFSGVNGYEL
jgi:hypothetical protein